MSWLNNSFNTIKGQLSNLAQEVLAETAGPGDDEYREKEVNTNTIEELRGNKEIQKEELDKLCEDKDREIKLLRQQINKLQNRKARNNEQISGASSSISGSKSYPEKPSENVVLEDSWYWEPDSQNADNARAEWATNSSGSAKSNANGELVEVLLDPTAGAAAPKNDKPNSKTIIKQDDDQMLLQQLIKELESDNENLHRTIEELDRQHEADMQEVINIKTEFQNKYETLSKSYEALKQEQASRFISNELTLANLQKENDKVQRALTSANGEKQTLALRIDDYESKLQKTAIELNELQEMLVVRNSEHTEIEKLVSDLQHDLAETDQVRIKAQKEVENLQKELEDLKNGKEKKTSESSNSSTSTGSKQTEDEFIVVREADESCLGATTPPTQQQQQQQQQKQQEQEQEQEQEPIQLEASLITNTEALGDKLIKLESRVAQLMHENEMLQIHIADSELERETINKEVDEMRTDNCENLEIQKRLNEKLSELESRLLTSENEKEQLQLKLQAQSEQLEAKSVEEKNAIVIDLEQKLKELFKENEALRNEIETSITRETITEDKQEVTDLDADEEVFNFDKLHDLIEAFINDNLTATPQETLEQCYKALKDRLTKINTLEERLSHMSGEISSLQESKSLWDHEKKTLEADISQYILQCEELMKNNEILLNELDNFKRNKLETINENHEDSLAQLEAQLEECVNVNHNLTEDNEVLKKRNEMLFSEISELLKLKEIEEGKLKLTLEKIEQEKCNLQFEVVEAKAAQEKSDIIENLELKCAQLAETMKRSQENHANEVNILKMDHSQLVHDNSYLRKKVDILEKQLREAEELRTQTMEELAQAIEALNSERILSMEQKQTTAAELDEKLLEAIKPLEAMKEELAFKNDMIKLLEESIEKYKTESEELKNTSKSVDITRIAQLEADLLASADLRKHMEALTFERNELHKALQQKHDENMQYYQEIQRLQPLAAAGAHPKPCDKCAILETNLNEHIREQEKLKDQVNFLREKSDILTTNLMTEQTNQKLMQEEKSELVEKNNTLRKDLERLRQHLLEIEELHTQETIEMQNDLEQTKAKMLKLQEEVSKSSTAYTSASIRANQQAETLQTQYALLVQQRDELLAKISWCEDRESKSQAALTNLQCALEQFQNDKEQDIKSATQRIRKELNLELQKEMALQQEITGLQQQLAEANQGLLAAARLSDQLESCQQTISTMREEFESLQQSKNKLEQQLRQSESHQTDKIDKNLIKSLLIGYVVSGNPNDKQQILRMISSVLDFNAQESDKVGLNKQQSGGWFGSLLGVGASANTNNDEALGTQFKDNLVQAFVKFLEVESQPPPVHPLLSTNAGDPNSPHAHGIITPPRARMELNHLEHQHENLQHSQASQLLTMNSNPTDFVPSRSSSSILKDILSDS